MLTVSERRACRVLGQVRRTQRYTCRVADDEAFLTANIVSLASAYGRYGYRRITALLKADGWRVNHKRVEVARKQNSRDVLRMLAGLMLRHGIPKHIRSDNGPEFVAKAVREWLSKLGVETVFIEPGSPWENG